MTEEHMRDGHRPGQAESAVIESTSLSNVHATRIPALCAHIHTLALKPRETALEQHLFKIQMVIDTMREDVNLILTDVPEQDLCLLRERWLRKGTPSRNRRRHPIDKMLNKKMKNVLDKSLGVLRAALKRGIARKCEEGARLVCAFVSGPKHWVDQTSGRAKSPGPCRQAYKQEHLLANVSSLCVSMSFLLLVSYSHTVMRKDGEHLPLQGPLEGTWININHDLILPALDHIVASWHATFSKNHFTDFVKSTMDALNAVFKTFLKSCPPSLRAYAENHAEKCRAGRELVLKQSLPGFEAKVRVVGRNITERFVPHIRELLTDSYALAKKEVGKGSFARQVVSTLITYRCEPF
jgi:hypothetical protein